MTEQYVEPHTGQQVTVRAPAKINLQLGVGPVRPDGYHPLATVYQAIGLYDDVTVTDDEQWSVQVTGESRIDVGEVPIGVDNIAVRAGLLLVEHHGLGERAARIEIHKGIPGAGGLAGGSADAAATLVALDRLWDLQTPDGQLLELAGRLGSDVPFALLGGTAIGSGRGELVTPVPDHGSWWWLVVENDEGLSTPAVYAAFDVLAGDTAVPEPVIVPDLLAALEIGDAAALAAAVGNDLTEPALSLRPDLRTTFEHAQEAGALTALLSGSGPTVLLLCESMAHAHVVHREMGERGYTRLSAVPAPVAGVHVVAYP